MQRFNVFPESSPVTMGAAIAGELHRCGEVELTCRENGAIAQVFSSLTVAKECLTKNYSLELVHAEVKGNEGTFLIKATKS